MKNLEMGRTRMIARRITGLFAASLVVLGFLAPAAAEPVKLSLLHINDIDRIEDLDGRGGLARLMHLVNSERPAAEPAIFPHGGDNYGSEHVRTPVTDAHLVCRLLIENK